MRRDPLYFREEELDLVYMAQKLSEALKVEEALTAEGIEYLVEAAPYVGGFLIRRELTGAYFYVAPEAAQRSREVLEAKGFPPYR